MTAPADLVVVGRIATLAGDDGPGWAGAIACAGGRVVAAGSPDVIDGLVGPRTRRLTLADDEVAIPGLTDAHLHLVDAALARSRVALEGCASMEELVGRVRAAAETGGARGGDGWIEGGGWDPDALGRWPTADDIELAAPGRRVALWAHDHHAFLASATALAEAGVLAGPGDPPGGLIRRDGDGRPTGVLQETATDLVERLIPAPSVEAMADAVRHLARELLAFGVVAVHDPGSLAARDGLGGPLDAYRDLAASGELGLRVHASIRAGQLEAAGEAGLHSGGPLGPDPLGRLRLGWLKAFADGSLGSRTAALLEPMVHAAAEDAPNDGLGVWLMDADRLRTLAARASALGIATQIHGIGDAAVRAALDALAPTVGATPLMPRVEHAQLVADDDIGRFAALGIAASVQPVHLRSDVDKARSMWAGDRAERRTFPLAALDRSRAVIAFGTDAPVEPFDPWPGLACAVTRSAPSWAAGTPPLGPGQAISLWRAVRAACVDPAITAGERDRGRLVAGQRADIVVLPAATFDEPVEAGGALWRARPRQVLVDGGVVAGG